MGIFSNRTLGLASAMALMFAATLVVPGCGKAPATNDTTTPSVDQPAPDPDNNGQATAPDNGVGDLPDIDFRNGPGPGSASARR